MYNPNDDAAAKEAEDIDAAAAEAFVTEQASKAELPDLGDVETGADIAAEGEEDDADVTQLMPDDDNEV